MPLHIGADEVRRRVEAEGAGWQVPEMALARVADVEPSHRLGYVPGPGSPSLRQAEQTARQRAAGSSAPAATAAAPASFDWRSRGGKSYVTPVKDQGACGSCVAFGVVAAAESLVRIAAKDPAARADLSEAQLFFCYGPERGAGPCPEGGWWPEGAFDGLLRGLADEATYRYTDVHQPCRLPAGWRTRVTRVTGWRVLSTPAAIKRHVSTVGPVTACLTVYEDLFYYGGGVYRPVTDLVAGGHCVCIVGYDDTRRCWIAKNSWGTGWGERGFLRIGYGQCGIDDLMWAADGVGVSTLRPWPVLRRGAKGHSVRTLQHLLRARGQQVPVDGDFGGRTETAVRRYQEGGGLASDGMVGARSWSRLVSTQRQGSAGDAVRALQHELRRRPSGSGLAVDGAFGPGTLRAVRAFQTAVRQSPDGVVGLFTWQALVGGTGTG